MKDCMNFSGKNYRIKSIRKIAEYQGARIDEIEIFAPDLAKYIAPSKFVILRIDEDGERIPLTIADYRDKALILVFQEMGYTTKKLAKLKTGDYIRDITYPLGQALTIDEPKEKKKVILVGGGVGTASIYLKTKALKEAGYHTIVLIGARNKDLLIMIDKFVPISDELYITTDDGSYTGKNAFFRNEGKNPQDFEKLFGTHVLDTIIDYESKNQDAKTIFPKFYNLHKANEIKEIIVVGPLIMMKFVSLLTKKMGIKTIASMNTLMMDGSGMCGNCKVTLDGKSKFCCVDGPMFDSHHIDFDELLSRSTYD